MYKTTLLYVFTLDGLVTARLL